MNGKKPGTVARLFGNLKGQRVRLAVVAASNVCYVGLAVWTPMYSAVVVDHLWDRVQCRTAGGPGPPSPSAGGWGGSCSFSPCSTWPRGCSTTSSPT